MPSRIAAMIALAALALGAHASAAPRPAAAAARDGYAMPADASPAADALPRADPPGGSGLYEDLDLPQIGDYTGEVLRYTSTGLSPTLVVQLAVVRPRQPVQVMVIRATGPSHLKEATRAFGKLPWADFVSLRDRALPGLLRPPSPEPREPPAPTPADSGAIAVTAVDQVCSLEFSGVGLSVRRQLDCQDGGDLDAVTLSLIELGERAAHPGGG